MDSLTLLYDCKTKVLQRFFIAKNNKQKHRFLHVPRYLSRKRNLNIVHRIITWLIWILLFLLGTEVGGNKMILEGLHTIGFEALVITLAAVAGSVLGAWGLWLFISYRDVKGGKE